MIGSLSDSVILLLLMVHMRLLSRNAPSTAPHLPLLASPPAPANTPARPGI
jgi:hypothetical protein